MKHMFVLLLTASALCCFCESVPVPSTDKKVEVVKLVKPVNFHQVTSEIFRSGQPETEELIALAKSHKLRSILNLRKFHSDRRKVAAANAQLPVPLKLYEIPLNTGSINEAHLLRILTVIRDAPKPLLIHCWHGSDRTGCAVAAYRIVFENQSVEAAVAELMKPEYGHHKTIYTNIPALLRRADWAQIKTKILGASLNDLTRKAEQGDRRSQCMLGDRYARARDFAKAVHWWKKAAAQGDAKAQYNLGLCYDKGYGTEKNPDIAAQYYEKAAVAGHAMAQLNSGFYHARKKDFPNAAKWFMKSALQGNRIAQYNIALCYEKGYGVEKNPAEAARYYRLSAEQGYMKAQCNLGVCYARGFGVAQDWAEAENWLQKAVSQGDKTAVKVLNIIRSR